MGQITDARIKEFQERAGLSRPTDKDAEVLRRMKQDAFQQIECIVLELSGIRDGDGQWHGNCPIHALVQQLSDLDNTLSQFDYARWENIDPGVNERKLTSASRQHK